MRTTKLVIPVIVLLAACDADVLSPTRQLPSATPVVARSKTALTMNTSPASASAIQVAWFDDARDEAGWEVHRSTTGAAGTFTLRASLPANSNVHTDGGLEILTEYCYKVRSFRTQGSRSTYGQFSNTSCATTLGPPRAPTGASAIPRSSTIVDVAWTINALTELRVERSPLPTGPWQTAATLQWNQASHVDFSRTPEEQVCYRIVATSQYGESASNVDCTAPPRGVSNITASSSDAQSIDVTWTDASNVEDGYSVQRASSDTQFTTIANLPANASSFRDGGVVPETRYQYRVRATRDGGFSDFSALAVAGVPTAPPVAPTALSASPGGSTVARLSWASTPPTVAGVRVQRSTDGQVSWVDAGSIAGDQPSFADGTREPEKQVCYRIFAFNTLGESGPSNIDCTIPPLNPLDVRLEPVQSGEWGGQTLSWTDRSNVEEGFLILIFSCSSAGCRSRDIALQPNETSFQLYLEPEEFIELYAYADGGWSDAGIWASAGAATPASSLIADARRGKLQPRLSARSAAPRTTMKRQSKKRIP
jgi:titin